jgi:hypothetical protein
MDRRAERCVVSSQGREWVRPVEEGWQVGKGAVEGGGGRLADARPLSPYAAVNSFTRLSQRARSIFAFSWAARASWRVISRHWTTEYRP